MAVGLPKERNPNWRGGRTVTPAGYVLIKDPAHPAADVRGYVYEHRLVMEAVLGRSLQPGERVRHRDGDSSNNTPGNLELGNRLDYTAMTACACGCGTRMTALDKAGRRRRFASGHNSQRRRREGHRPRRETGAGLHPEYREDLLEQFGHRCAYGCGRVPMCWDHVIPWCEGGSFRYAGNAVPACRPCNLAKSGTAEIWPWIERGLRSAQGDAWLDLVSVALSWGALDPPLDDGHGRVQVQEAL